eukprot:754973-Hanusia_phi.AAC.2
MMDKKASLTDVSGNGRESMLEVEQEALLLQASDVFQFQFRSCSGSDGDDVDQRSLGSMNEDMRCLLRLALSGGDGEADNNPTGCQFDTSASIRTKSSIAKRTGSGSSLMEEMFKSGDLKEGVVCEKAGIASFSLSAPTVFFVLEDSTGIAETVCAQIGSSLAKLASGSRQEKVLRDRIVPTIEIFTDESDRKCSEVVETR